MKNRNGKAVPFLQELVFSFFPSAHQHYYKMLVLEGSFYSSPPFWRMRPREAMELASVREPVIIGTGSGTQLFLNYHKA